MNKNLRLLASRLQTMEELVDPEYQPLSAENRLDDALFSSFATSQQRIAELAKQLVSHIQEYNELKQALQFQHDVSSSSKVTLNNRQMMPRKAAPIDRCPDEVLVHIFGVIAGGGSHLMRSLLLVDTRFHHLVMNNTRLWTKISLRFDQKLKEINHLSHRYVDTCLLRSRESPLNICLDYSLLQDPDSFLFLAISDRLAGLVENAELDDFMSSLDIFNRDVYCPPYEENMNHISDLVGLLAGQEGTNAQRWSSLVLSLPKYDFMSGRKVWDIITRLDTPNLRTLELQDHIYLQNYLWEIGDEEGIKAFRNLSSITHLSMKGEIDKLAPVNFTLLKRLDFDFLLNSNALSQCESLQELTIHCSEGHRISPEIGTNIQLPLLTSLTLTGYLAILRPFQFHLPRLEHLCFSRPIGLYIPSIEASHVQLVFGWHFESDGIDVRKLFFTELLKTFGATVSLEIQTDEFELAEDCNLILCAMLRQGRLPSSLQSIELSGFGSLDLTPDDPLARRDKPLFPPPRLVHDWKGFPTSRY
ncbi:hypothetical protein FS842_009367 [Serendipita sp. 407]|nr:hypothetical protein FS842_009367 [Serendipita sp. 407]